MFQCTPMLVGSAVMVATMIWKGLYSNEAIYYSLIACFIVFVVVSLLTPKPSGEKLAEWEAVTRGEAQIAES